MLPLKASRWSHSLKKGLQVFGRQLHHMLTPLSDFWVPLQLVTRTSGSSKCRKLRGWVMIDLGWTRSCWCAILSWTPWAVLVRRGPGPAPLVPSCRHTGSSRVWYHKVEKKKGSMSPGPLLMWWDSTQQRSRSSSLLHLSSDHSDPRCTTGATSEMLAFLWPLAPQVLQSSERAWGRSDI